LAAGCERGKPAARCGDVAARFAGNHASAPPPGSGGGLEVVTLNIEFGIRIDRARSLFARAGLLARANVVLLQEMDPEGTDALAASLGMQYVYYPADVHPRTGRLFGNAVLSRWPIVGDRKIELPHVSFRNPTRRAATCATVMTPAGAVEVCSLHLATPFELLPGARRDQVREVVRHLRGVPRVVLGGDLNSYRLGRIVAADAFDWATRTVGPTVGSLFSVDHIFTRGLRVSQVGRVTAMREATDHAAVWARLAWR
jgi:endonuclease/exonuclease/phosphatase family metal-dependent hydrolase